MPLPAIDPYQRATYPDLREVVAVLEREESQPPAPGSRPLGENLGQRTVEHLRDCGPEKPQTCADIAQAIGMDPANVANWLKQTGFRFGVTCVGLEKRRPRVRAEKLYVVKDGVAGTPRVR